MLSLSLHFLKNITEQSWSFGLHNDQYFAVKYEENGKLLVPTDRSDQTLAFSFSYKFLSTRKLSFSLGWMSDSGDFSNRFPIQYEENRPVRFTNSFNTNNRWFLYTGISYTGQPLHNFGALKLRPFVGLDLFWKDDIARELYSSLDFQRPP